MKKYILISKSYTGEIIFIFVEGILAMFDIRGAELNEQQRTWILEHLPRDEKALELYNSKFTITAVDQAVSFEQFWNKYDDKEHSSKKRTLAKWNKMPASEQVKAYNYIKNYNRTILPGCAKKYAETYLNAEMWNN